MSIETFAVAESSPSYTTTFRNSKTIVSNRKGHVVDDFRSAIEGAGWTRDETNSPYAYVDLILRMDTLPTATVPPEEELASGNFLCDAVVGVIETHSTNGSYEKIVGYDPGRFLAPGCPSLAYAETQYGTFLTWIDAIEGATGMTVSGWTTDSLGWTTVRLTAAVPGPALNGLHIDGWGSGEVWFGGWTHVSGTYRTGYLTVTQFEVTIGFDIQWRFQIQFHAGTPKTAQVGLGIVPDILGVGTGTYDVNPPYQLMARTRFWDTWRFVGCPYQFALWFEGGPDWYTEVARANRSLFVSMPWVPEDFEGYQSFAFIATSNTLNSRGRFIWTASSAFGTDSAFGSYVDGQIIIPVMRTRYSGYSGGVGGLAADTLRTTQSAVIADNAYITVLGTGGVQSHRVVGKLWNCCTLSQGYPLTTTTTNMMESRWLHVASNEYYPDVTAPVLWGVQSASLWWKVDS